jgi:predicted phosphoribosyltransferase
MIFSDRIEAAKLLADKLEVYKEKNALILAIPRGGVPMGYIIAKQLNLPLEVVLSKKIGHPLHKEFAIGAVTLKSQVLSEAAKEVSKSYIEEETKKIRTLLSNRYQYYYGNKKPQELKDKILIIVDDGIATGNTIISTLEMLHKEQPKKIVVAIPVSSQSALQKLKSIAFVDEVICLSAPINFRAVGRFYENFDQVDDAQVKTFLNSATVN